MKVKKDSAIFEIAQLIHKWWVKNPHGYNAVCQYGHTTCCTQCSSIDDQLSYERLSEIGR